MPGFDSGEALRLVQERCPGVPLILVSGAITEDEAVESITSGAADYVWKDRLQRLGPAIESALRERRYQAEREDALHARRESEALSDAVLASLSQLICVIDPDGVIVKTNTSWKRAGAERGTNGLVGLDVGTNYLDVCRRAAASGDESVLATIAGISAVLAGERDSFEQEYPCHGPTGRAWYNLCVTPLSSGLGAVLSHQSVTDLREVQEVLAQKQSWLEAIFEGSLDAKLLADDAGRYVDANPAAAALLGYSREELLRLSVPDVLPPARRPGFSERWAAAQAHGTDSRELTLCRKDGTMVDVEQRATFNVLPGFHLSVLRDITERRAAEAAIAEAARRNAEILESIGDGFFALNADWRFTHVNGDAERFLRRSRVDLVGQHIWEVLPEGLETIYQSAFEQARLDGVAVRFTSIGPISGKWIDVRAFPFGGGLTVFFRDVTEEKRAEAALRESKERLQLVSLATHDAVWDWDMRTDQFVANPAFGEVFGWRDEAAAGFDNTWMRERMHPDDQARAFETFLAIAAGTETSWMSEHRFERADGTWADVLERGYIVRENGVPIRTIGAMIDISARKATERALVEAKEAAEEVAQAKSAILMNMSHEIRTPLTAVIGYAEMLALEAPPDLMDLVVPIERGGKRLLDTLNSVLDLAQIEAGAVPLATVTVDLRAEADAAIAALEPLAQAKGLTLSLAGPPTAVLADRAALARVLTNLVGNAIKFTEDGTVAVDMWTGDGSAWLRVTDTGVGIAPAFLPNVFEDFKQESSGTGRSHEGSGLGLTITRGLLAMMDGEISVASEKGVGSTFTVRLPAA